MQTASVSLTKAPISGTTPTQSTVVKFLSQPNQLGWQVFDQKVVDKLRDEYPIRQITKVTADTIEELSTKLEGVNATQFVKTVEEFNEAVMDDVPFNPTVLDGRGTKGLDVPKTNWANKLDEPPYEAYQITCGITFTFGGLKVDSARARWLIRMSIQYLAYMRRASSWVAYFSSTIRAAQG